MASLKLSIFIIGILFIMPLHSLDLGVKGHIFPISEMNLICFIKEQIEETSIDKTIEIQKILKSKVLKSLTHPTEIHLSNAKEYKTFDFDPTIHASKAITDRKGNIIVQKGQKYNPLETINLSENILIFDGTNQKHIEWADCCDGKWVLTKGSPLELEKRHNKPVYFDQYGKISNRLGIKSIPAKVSQNGNKLKIEEIPCL